MFFIIQNSSFMDITEFNNNYSFYQRSYNKGNITESDFNKWTSSSENVIGENYIELIRVADKYATIAQDDTYDSENDYYILDYENQYYTTLSPTVYQYVKISFPAGAGYKQNKYYILDEEEYKISNEVYSEQQQYYEKVKVWNDGNKTSPDIIIDVELITGTPNKYYILHSHYQVSQDEEIIPNKNYYTKTSNDPKYITLSAAESTYPLSIGNVVKEQERHFKVSWDGTCYITDGKFSGEITAESGTIGGWNIGSDTLIGGDLILDSSDGSITGGVLRSTDTQISLIGDLLIKPDENSDSGVRFGALNGRDGEGTTGVVGIYNNTEQNLIIENKNIGTPAQNNHKNIRIGNNIDYSDLIILSGVTEIQGKGITWTPYFNVQDQQGTYNEETGKYESLSIFSIGKNTSGEYYLSCGISASNQTGIYARFA